MTGVLLSSPLLFLISIWIAWTVYRASSTTISREQIRNIIGLSIVALSSIWLAWANASIWTEVFWGSGSPCGPDHAASAPGAAANATLVAMVYGAWPLLIAIKSALVLIVVVGARSKAGE